MGRFTEKQLLLATIVVSALLVLAFGGLIYLELDRINRNEVTEQHPEASEVSDPDQWGERRWIQEIQKQMEAAKSEADLIPRREQDVIVYREIVQRDSAILPDFDDVNRLATTINEFETQSGVTVKRVAGLNVGKDAGSEAIRTMPVKLQLQGSFDQFLKFVNLFETLDRMVNTNGFTVNQGKVIGEGRDRQAIHDIQLDLVTFIYTSSAGLTKPVDIANYDRRKEDPVIQKLVRQQKAAHVDKYQLKPRINRRDPLVDPRRHGGDAQGPGSEEETAKQKASVDRLKLDLELLKEDVRQEASYIQDHKWVQVSQLKPIIDEKVAKLEMDILQVEPGVTAPELRESLHDEAIAPFESIKAQRKLVNVPVIMTKKQVAEFLERMRIHQEAREYEKVVHALGDYDKFVKGMEIAEDAQELIGEMRAVGHAAQAMIDFLALHVTMNGLILRPEGSMVILNGATHRTGDFVDASNRCRLKEIHENRLVFELDGFEIEHLLDKK